MSLEVSVSATFAATGATPFEVDVDLTVDPAETLVVLGPSGSGKTLLLETIAGYHDHEGTVRSDGRVLTDEPPEARDFGFVFQNYALFPHMTVQENVAFGTRYHQGARDPDEVLAELGIEHLADRTPATLSGGEAQRVALARSLAIRPATMLLDEPLSALDVPTRESLRSELGSIIDDATALYVTHNRTTARDLGDRIAVMRAGRVVQVGTPEAVFERPATPFVARFTGANCVPADVWKGAIGGEDGSNHGDDDRGPPPGEEELGSLPGEEGAGPDCTAACIGVRPEHVVLGDGGLRATVVRASKGDVATRVALARDGDVVEAYTTEPPDEGAETTVRFPRDRVVWLPEDDESTEWTGG